MLTIVTGAGYTGKRVLDRLPDAIALSRTKAASEHESAIIDLDTDKTLPVVLPEQYRIIYTVPPGGESGDERLRHFLQLLDPVPLHFVYLSTTGVYGDRGGKSVDEAAQLRPGSDRALRRVFAEQHLSDWTSSNRCGLTILRVPGIYGPDRLGEVRLRDREAVLRDADADPGNRIHVDDLVTCCIAALTSPAGTYNVGDGDERSSTWFATEVAKQLGLPAPPQVSRAGAARTFSPQRLSFLSESRRVDTRKMRDVLGVTPRYGNAEDGIKASLNTR